MNDNTSNSRSKKPPQLQKLPPTDAQPDARLQGMLSAEARDMTTFGWERVLMEVLSCQLLPVQAVAPVNELDVSAAH